MIYLLTESLELLLICAQRNSENWFEVFPVFKKGTFKLFEKFGLSNLYLRIKTFLSIKLFS